MRGERKAFRNAGNPHRNVKDENQNTFYMINGEHVYQYTITKIVW